MNRKKTDPAERLIEKGAELVLPEPGMLKPAKAQIGKLLNQGVEVGTTLAAIPLNILQIALVRPSAILERALETAKRRGLEITAANGAAVYDVVKEIPSSVEPELEKAWEVLISRAIDGNDHKSVYAKVLSELTASEVQLLNVLVGLQKKGNALSVKNLKAANLPKGFCSDTVIDYEHLGISLTILEREKLIATSNNLGLLVGPDKEADPLAHRVTPLGYALHKVCVVSWKRKEQK